MDKNGVILDIDGTLVDSNDAHARAWVDVLAEAGYKVPYQRVRRLIGMGGDKLLPEVTGIGDDEPKAQGISRRRSEIFHEKYLARVRPFPKTRELLQRFVDEGWELAVATSAKKPEMAPLLEIAGVTDLIDTKTSSDDAEHSKPDPDIVAAALRKVGCSAARALMLGDTPYDIEAAQGCGVRTVALRCGGWDDEGLQGALATYEDPADLLAHFEDSPFAQQR